MQFSTQLGGKANGKSEKGVRTLLICVDLDTCSGSGS